MTWFVEHLHRDGTVITRMAVNSWPLTIGRALDNHLVLDDIHCAPYHAHLNLHGDGRAELVELGTLNGITTPKGKRINQCLITDDQALRLGQSTLRIRSAAWPLPPEQVLPAQRTWIWALLAICVVMTYTLWDAWLGDVNAKSPPYLYSASGIFAAFAVWSAFYALLGRLIRGGDRFFSHVLIACCGYMAGVAFNTMLNVLSFATGWLWPEQIQQHMIILVVALTVRSHLRLADPRHWHVMRWGVAVAAMGAMLVPLAQLWISSHRFTRIQVLEHIEHPALRLAKPVSVQTLSTQANALKARADKARQQDSSDEDEGLSED